MDFSFEANIRINEHYTTSLLFFVFSVYVFVSCICFRLQYAAIHTPNIYFHLCWFRCFFRCSSVCSTIQFLLFIIIYLFLLVCLFFFFSCSTKCCMSALFYLSSKLPWICLRATKTSEIDKSRSKNIHSELFMLLTLLVVVLIVQFNYPKHSTQMPKQSRDVHCSLSLAHHCDSLKTSERECTRTLVYMYICYFVSVHCIHIHSAIRSFIRLFVRSFVMCVAGSLSLYMSGIDV